MNHSFYKASSLRYVHITITSKARNLVCRVNTRLSPLYPYNPVLRISSGGTTNQKNFTQSDIDLMARVVYAESRGEPYKGQVAVAAVMKIFELLEQRKIIPMRSRRGTYVLSGILRCGKCESTLQFP